VVISRTEYEFLSGAHQCMDRLEDGTAVCYTSRLAQGHSRATTTSRRGIIFHTTWGAAVSSCTVWLKTLNLALMRGTPQSIRLFLVVFVLPLFLFIFFLFSSITFVFYFQGQKWYFGSSLGV
jgi:hypothetical protein